MVDADRTADDHFNGAHDTHYRKWCQEADAVTCGTPTMQDIQNALAGTRFEKLQQTGYALVAQGLVAYEEIERTVGR